MIPTTKTKKENNRMDPENSSRFNISDSLLLHNPEFSYKTKAEICQI